MASLLLELRLNAVRVGVLLITPRGRDDSNYGIICFPLDASLACRSEKSWVRRSNSAIEAKEGRIISS